MGYRINHYKNYFLNFSISLINLYYNLPWKDEHECTPSVHDQFSKGNYNKDTSILFGAALYLK